ncbi:plasmid stabilization protein [Thiothrix litoralis]|jgi:plasmid stability protein|uniref:Plasmid stabilization protein n=1 Tax=Thiothrix litoralis TaxID=2891210 RepID=A0ABX7WWS1_9GAMM|nr:plasmid stabilization protein [Thiothrix litoralis]QTR48080.1 plasmid stabilization protein [Thiothrix litoralis]
MAMLTIRNLDDDLKTQLRIRAAQHGLSMEEEVRRILQQILAPQTPQKGFGTRVHQRVMALSNGVDLPLPKRSLPRSAPDFSGEAA